MWNLYYIWLILDYINQETQQSTKETHQESYTDHYGKESLWFSVIVHHQSLSGEAKR